MISNREKTEQKRSLAGGRLCGGGGGYWVGALPWEWRKQTLREKVLMKFTRNLRGCLGGASPPTRRAKRECRGDKEALPNVFSAAQHKTPHYCCSPLPPLSPSLSHSLTPSLFCPSSSSSSSSFPNSDSSYVFFLLCLRFSLYSISFITLIHCISYSISPFLPYRHLSNILFLFFSVSSPSSFSLDFVLFFIFLTLFSVILLITFLFYLIFSLSLHLPFLFFLLSSLILQQFVFFLIFDACVFIFLFLHLYPVYLSSSLISYILSFPFLHPLLVSPTLSLLSHLSLLPSFFLPHALFIFTPSLLPYLYSPPFFLSLFQLLPFPSPPSSPHVPEDCGVTVADQDTVITTSEIWVN